jgi:hypothetical protein
MPATESQSSIPVRTAQQTQTTKSSRSQPVQTAQRMQTTESIHLQGCPDVEVKTADGDAFCATVRMRFSNFMKTQL